MKLALLTVAALGATGGSVLADIQFAAPTTITSVPSLSRDMELADLDGDGDADLVVAVAVPATAVRIYANDGSGGYVPSASYPLPEWSEATDIADVDGDGDLDIVALSYFLESHVTALLNDGTGAFIIGPQLLLAANVVPADLELGDIDGDGLLDTVISYWGPHMLTIHRGNGIGAFQAGTSYPVLNQAFDVELADLNGDLALDIAVSNFGGQPTFTIPGEVWVFLNDGMGGLGAPGKYVADRGTWGLSSGDIDQDGDLDLVATNRNMFNVSRLENLGDGTFAPSVPTAVGPYPVAARLADFDGDGALECAVPSSNLSGPTFPLHVLENDRSQLVPGEVILTPLPMEAVLSGDVDGDSDLDLVLSVSGELWLMRNQTPQLDPLLLDVNHLVAGQSAQIGLENGTPLSLAFVAISFAGQAPPLYLPVLDTTFSLHAPLLLTTGVVGVSGELGWSFPLPPSAQSIGFWLQALQFQASSGVIQTQVN